MRDAANRTLETRVPARLDRLPWGRFHTLVAMALGITWVSDGLEVTLAGSIAGALEASPSLRFTASGIGLLRLDDRLIAAPPRARTVDCPRKLRRRRRSPRRKSPPVPVSFRNGKCLNCRERSRGRSASAVSKLLYIIENTKMLAIYLGRGQVRPRPGEARMQWPRMRCP